MNRWMVLSIVAVLLSTVTNAYEYASARQTNGGCSNLDGMIQQYLLF